jgi:two-component system chemotaxis response regulator CheY
MTMRVLAMDDWRTIRTLLSSALQANGCRVVTAEDGLAGLEKFEADPSDVGITDINMPRLDGFSVIKRIRSGDRAGTVPIMVLSTESAATLKTRARQAGATGWIVKPFDEASLLAAHRRVTGL